MAERKDMNLWAEGLYERHFDGALYKSPMFLLLTLMFVFSSLLVFAILWRYWPLLSDRSRLHFILLLIILSFPWARMVVEHRHLRGLSPQVKGLRAGKLSLMGEVAFNSLFFVVVFYVLLLNSVVTMLPFLRMLRGMH